MTRKLIADRERERTVAAPRPVIRSIAAKVAAARRAQADGKPYEGQAGLAEPAKAPEAPE